MKRRGSLLVVDDSEFNRDALSRRLLQRGFAVDTAADGPDALEHAMSGWYDLVLLDVELPGMSGLDVLQRVRESHSRTDLPIIMVTSKDQPADRFWGMKQGATEYVTKPFKAGDLVDVVRKHA